MIKKLEQANAILCQIQIAGGQSIEFANALILLRQVGDELEEQQKNVEPEDPENAES